MTRFLPLVASPAPRAASCRHDGDQSPGTDARSGVRLSEGASVQPWADSCTWANKWKTDMCTCYRSWLGDLPSSSIHYDLSECKPIYSMTYYGKIYDKTPVVVRQCTDPPVYFQPPRSAGVGHPRQMSAIRACLRRAWRDVSPNGRLCRHQSAASSTHRVLLGAGWLPCLPSGHGGLCTT